MVLSYREFMKAYIHDCDGNTMQEKFKKCATEWHEYKKDNGIEAAPKKPRSRKPRAVKAKGGELSYSPLGGNAMSDVWQKVKKSGLINKALDKGIDLAAKKLLGGNFGRFKEKKDHYEASTGKKFYGEMLAGVLEVT